jgi:hypothetical protein
MKLHDDGLIYKGTYMVNWAPKLQTAVLDLEVEYADEPGTLYYFKYPVAPIDGDDESLFLEVATSRPETILGDTAVAVNPNDERFQHLIGRECLVPFTNPPRRVPIIGDEYVDVDFGTGALKVTPGHDPNDYDIGKRVGLPTINIMNKDGTMNNLCGTYENLDRFVCRETLWKDMEETGLAIKTEPYNTRVPRSQRGGEIIEPLVSEQWFVKMDSMAAPALAGVGVRRAHHRAHEVRKNLPRLAHGHTGLVHLEAALVGTQDPGVLRAQGRRRARGGARGRGERVILRVRRRARRRGGVRQGERHARRCVWRWLGVVPGRGRFGHVVLLRLVAVLHAGVAEGRRGGFGKVLPHDGDGDGPRHLVLLGRAHGDAVVRHDREAAFQDGVPARARARREGKKDVQVPRERRRTR